MQRHDFAYHLPPELIAQTPLAERSASRLLVLDDAQARANSDQRSEADHRPEARGGSAADQRSEARDGSVANQRSEPSDRSGANQRSEAKDRSVANRLLDEAALQPSTDGSWYPPPRDCTMRDFPNFLRPGDLLVFNDTKVVAARLLGTKPSGGRVEIFLERAVSTHEAVVQLRASKPIREGLEVTTAGGAVRVLGRQDDLWLVAFPAPVLDFFERWGDVPLPPYIHRAADANDRERYQSIFARERGAVAAPTASLHFDPDLIREIEARGVNRAFVTLHVGAGTFQPLRTDDLDSHVMHAERVSVSQATWEAINKTHARGGRVVAIGTTVVRALESGVLASGGHGPKADWSGETRLFIRPGFTFRVIDALLTNFHLPESTLLMLVCAFGGTDRVLAAYQHAVRARYRFFSYGDAMFLTKSRVTG